MKKNIFLFGLGAIGSNLLVQLVNKFPALRFTGIDFDIVEERNIATQAYMLPHIGMPKVNAANIILGLNVRKFTYKGINVKITSDMNLMDKLTLLPEQDLLIDCFDNAGSRRIIHSLGKNNSLDILHIGFSPQYTAEIIWDRDYSVPGDIPEDQDDICDMPDAVPFIQFVVSLGCMCISDFLLHSIKRSLLVVNRYVIREL